MSNHILKEIKIILETKQDFSDQKVLALREANITAREYSKALQKMIVYNDLSEKLLRFIAEYDNGFWFPEKCDAYEPINEDFNIESLSAPVRWLSQPGCGVFLKKTKLFKYTAVIENNRLAQVWEEGGLPLSIHKKDPKYLGTVTFFISGKLIKIQSFEYIETFFKSLANVILASHGEIIEVFSDGRELRKKILDN